MNMTSYSSSFTIFVPKWLSDQESQFSDIKSLSILLMSKFIFHSWTPLKYEKNKQKVVVILQEYLKFSR